MNPAFLYALGGAAFGYFNSRTKKGRPVAALKGLAVGFALTKVAERYGVRLPTLPAPRA